jgi:hypothetical protein
MRHPLRYLTLFAWLMTCGGLALVVVVPAVSGPYADVSNLWILGCVFVFVGLEAVLTRLVLGSLQRSNI